MIYFKKVYFNYDEKAKIEAALRKLSLKRTRSLDFESTKYDTGNDKYFLGYEGKSALYFTRLKSSVEFFLPKIIFSLSKSETDFFYKFRLSVVWMIVLLLLSFILIAVLVDVITGDTSVDSFMEICLLFFVFLALVLFELWITSRQIKKAIVKFQAV